MKTITFDAGFATSTVCPLSLRFLTAVSRLLPPVRGAARIAFRCIRPLYRRQGTRVLPIWPGVRMLVDPADYLGGFLAFLPHVYERWERRTIASILRPGDVFIDVGSNIGAYALWAAHCLGKSGRVLAIEADERNHETLVENIRLNDFSGCIDTLNCGISDKSETLPFHRNTTGNCGGHNFAGFGAEGPGVKCVPLHEALTAAGIGVIRIMKLDVEGFEGRILERYFAETAAAKMPEYLLVEINDGPSAESEKALLRRLIAAQGYLPLRESGNTLFKKSEPNR